MTGERIRVLYVDDEETNLFIFKELMKRKYDVITAALPSEALNVMNEEEGIDVVISDMKMPQMDGVEFIKNARKKYADLAYFILTAFENNEDIEQAVEDRVIIRSFIKPLNVEEISTEISKALS